MILLVVVRSVESQVVGVGEDGYDFFRRGSSEVYWLMCAVLCRREHRLRVRERSVASVLQPVACLVGSGFVPGEIRQIQYRGFKKSPPPS